MNAQESLLDTLIENTLVKAALVITPQGRIAGRRGQARVLKHTTSRFDQTEPTEQLEKPLENLYVVEIAQNFLAVVFEDKVEFDHVRHMVDTLIKHAGLELQDP